MFVGRLGATAMARVGVTHGKSRSRASTYADGLHRQADGRLLRFYYELWYLHGRSIAPVFKHRCLDFVATLPPMAKK